MSEGNAQTGNNLVAAGGEHVFAATSIQRRKKLTERLAHVVFLLMTLALVAPLVAIFAYLLIKSWPELSLSFIFENLQLSVVFSLVFR